MLKSRFLLVLMLLNVLVMPVFGESWAQESTEQDPLPPTTHGSDSLPPTTYDSGIILMNIGGIDEVSGTYWLDFFFYMKSDDVDFTQEVPEIVFMNARDIDMEEPHITTNYYEVRVRGDFATQLNFEKFPYEIHELTVEIEPKIPHDSSRFVFDKDVENIIDSEMKIFSNLKMFDSNVEVMSHTYFDGLEFSRIVATYSVGSEPIGSTLKTILPATIIVGISLMIFFVPEHYTPRIYLTAPLLLAAVYWHQSSLGHLPSLGYTTIFDRVMILYYLLFVNSILSLVVQMRVSAKDKNNIRAKKYNRIFSYSTIAILAYVAIRIITEST